MGEIDDLTVDTLRQAVRFKYYNIPGRTHYMIASYKSDGYEHAILVMLPDEFARLIDDKLYESVLAMQAYAYEHPEDSLPTEIVSSSPRKIIKQPEDGTVVVTTKTPQQLQKEERDRIERLGAE